MKSLCIISQCALLLLVSGCGGAINHQQYQITGPARADGVHASVSADERERLREILTTVAARYKLKDMTEISLTPDVIVSLQEQDSENPLKLTARVVHDRILIDLMRTLPEVGETLRHQALKEMLFSELQNAFGDRFSPRDFRKPLPAPASP